MSDAQAEPVPADTEGEGEDDTHDVPADLTRQYEAEDFAHRVGLGPNQPADQ